MVKKFGGFLFLQRYAFPRPLTSVFTLLKCVMDMVRVADVSSYCELRLAQKRNLVGFYFRDVMQFPVLLPPFLTLLKCFTDMVRVADVSSYCEL